MKTEQSAHAFVSAFVDELARSGVRNVCICPGSRSTPLAVLLAQHHDLSIWMHLDERSAAFFALGMAKSGGAPVAVLCTSGTAAANFLPAAVEARYARVPLLLLTADRPPELRDIGANQTIDQLDLYGTHVKWSVDVGLPDASNAGLRYARNLADRAVAFCLTEPSGPVHLNFPFREPLVPVAPDQPVTEKTAYPRTAISNQDPAVVVSRGARAPDDGIVEALVAEVEGIERGLIVCGPQDDSAFPAAVARLAEVLGYPILADPLSQVRCGRHDRRLVLDAYDAFLRDPDWVVREPAVVLRFGAVPTSKPLQQYLEQHEGCRQIVVDGGAGWRDPALRATRVVFADACLVCDSLVRRLGETESRMLFGGVACDTDGVSAGERSVHTVGIGRENAAVVGEQPETEQRGLQEGGGLKVRGGFAREQRRSDWLRLWLRADEVTRQAIAGCLLQLDEPFEGRVFAELAELLPGGTLLFAGNSMPVRDLDTFFAGSNREIRCLANRGASGIDGVVSSALGAAATQAGPVVLVVGDLSFYHDLNGLFAAKRHQLDVTIVLLNNDGGGIFSFLPQAQQSEDFELLFGTPHGLDFEPAVRMFGGSFRRFAGWSDFASAVQQPAGQGLRVIEVPTERERNVALHRLVWDAVSHALEHHIQPQAAV